MPPSKGAATLIVTAQSSVAQKNSANLCDKHLKELTQRRGLDEAWVKANCRSLTTEEAREYLGYTAKSGGILLEGVGSQIQFKPDKPWKNEGDKKAAKYRSPLGDYDAMLPINPDDPAYWSNLEALKSRCYQIDGHPCLVITEGFFKAIAGCSNGIPTIALLGVEMGLTSAKADIQGKRYLVPGLEHFARAGFGFIIGFDADCTTNKAVLWAQLKLAEQLLKFKVPVYSITGNWSIEQGKGMDDYIQNNGADKFKRDVLGNTIAYSDWLKIQKLEGQFSKESKKPPTPRALADNLTNEFLDKWAYDLSQQTWRIWNGKFWEREHEKVCLSILKAQVQAMGIEYPREAYIKDALESLSLILLRKTWESFDRSERIAGINGVLSLTTGKVEPHEPGFGFTSVLPHEVLPFSPAYSEREILRQLQENCPEVHHFFSSSVLGSNQKILQLLAVVAGILRFRFSKLQKFVHLIGDPGTGKGTFMRLLKDVVGSTNTQSASLTNLGDGSVMARIIDAQLALFPDERKQVGVEWLLKLTGGDDIDYRKVYTAGASSPFHGSVVVASNSPVFSGDTTGLDRRLCLIPFLNVIPSHQRDPDLQDRLKAEVPKLISVALAMPQSLVDDLIIGRGIGQMNDIRWHEWQMKVQTDKVAAFIDEMVIADDSTACGAKTLFDAYLEWAKQNNHSNAGSQSFFGQRFRQYMKWLEMSESKRLHGCVRYINIRLREEGELIPPIQDLLSPNCPPSPGGDTLGDTGGTPCKPLSEPIRDTRDTFSIKDFPEQSGESLERIEVPTEDNSSPNKKFSPESVPTLPYPLPEQDTAPPPSMAGGQLNPPPPQQIDFSTFPHRSSENLKAKQKLAGKIKQQLLEANSKEELSATKGEFGSSQVQWVWQNLLTSTERQKITDLAKTEQLNLLAPAQVAQPSSTAGDKLAQGEVAAGETKSEVEESHNFKIGDWVMSPVGKGQVIGLPFSKLVAVCYDLKNGYFQSFEPHELSPINKEGDSTNEGLA